MYIFVIKTTFTLQMEARSAADFKWVVLKFVNVC